ncbi:phosphoglycerate mutase-like protein [Dacryopinax primogenitus]|uniref:Phosphoglycerate mutase-like protein n=1 Tax=Dacryopinax primogenitus (strain DJM 731) TaxID=1858805 RepID=M5FY98_DACPD|nr:phosphoglycerate mutase-like protein [Dacryopinax primogenitus]EJU00795.1 phosphoglycerate mutase-like protein [Dacryopinax primogenitus]
MAPPVMLRVWVVRHGETDENQQGIVQGQLDTKLNAKGRVQASRTGEALATIPFKNAYSSDLSRAVEARLTAKAILSHHSHVDLKMDTALRERDMGILTGKLSREMSSDWRTKARETMEPHAQFLPRTLAFWRKLLSLYGLPDSLIRPEPDAPYDILVVSHGAWIAMLLRNALARQGYTEHERVPAANRVHNCSVALVSVYTNGLGQVELYDDYRHLVGEENEGNEPSENTAELAVEAKMVETP